MRFSSIRRSVALRLLVPLGIGMAFHAALLRPSHAAEGLDFVLPDTDGYGIADCMKPGLECGRVIADAWCEAHGHGHASAFGLSDDVTGSTKVSMAVATPVPAHAVIIHCGD